MVNAPIGQSSSRRPLRLWPGVAIVALQWLVYFGAPAVLPGTAGGYAGVIGGFIGGLAVMVWWLFFSRAAWVERLGAVALMIAALAATPLILHESIRTGAMGVLFYVYVFPGLALAFVAWALATRQLTVGVRRVTMAAAILLACGMWALLRTDGVMGEGGSQFAWRWSPTHEERLLARLRQESAAPAARPREQRDESSAAPGVSGPPDGAPDAQPPAAPVTEPAAPQPPASGTTASEAATAPAPAKPAAEWPGFRGPGRDSIVRGVRIGTDWSQAPPVELWRRPVGPGWSSFAVNGDRLYTQEQLGEAEIVACYRVSTGEPVWKHTDAARFWESNAGPGPRATPTLHDGRVYTFGATGILNALDAEDGAVVWARNVASDTETEVPTWGFASSPLIAGDLVVVAAAGRLAAYDHRTGERRWYGPTGGWGYSSPHLATLDGVRQIVLLHGAGAIGVRPADGTVLWEHRWRGDGIVQPALVAGDVLIGSGSGMADAVGVRRIAVARGDNGWTVDERWTTNGLKPYFNDFVVHEGHAFGFDGRLLSCIDLASGARTWKGGRYGHGQVVLLPEQDLLLVLSEQGELALVRAVPDRYEELARVPAIEGKTWNHPVLVGDVLLVRNGQEMAAFRLR